MEESSGVGRRSRLAAWLFGFGLLVYLVTRLTGLTKFPIFFFCDEAIQANTAASLAAHHFKDSGGVFLPPYFLNDKRWAMSLNIYLLVLPIVLLGKTIAVTRGVFVAVSLFGAAAAAFGLKLIRSPAWWSAPLFLAAMPIDFLHSRIAFETTPACYAAFLCGYLLYRLVSPRWVFAAILAGAAVFYSYTAGQGIMLITGLLLLFVDIRYHLLAFRGRSATLAAALLLLAVVAVPFFREQRRHPQTTREQLTVLESYWIKPIPLSGKLAIFGKTYARAFRPAYWFRVNGEEVTRHRTDGMAYVPPAFAPLVLIGIGVCAWKWRRSPGHRVVLLSPIGVPFAAAADQLQVLRILPMVVPLALLAAVGAGQLLAWVRPVFLRAALAPAIAAVLAAAAVRITVVSLKEGPRWSNDYGLYGMQYGASQVFAGVRAELAASPATRVHVASVWANNPFAYIEFFLKPPEQARTNIDDVDRFFIYREPVGPNEVFVMTPEQYQTATSSPKLVVSAPLRTIVWPDGRTGFYFVRFRYSDAADAIFAAEREARRRPVEGTVEIGGETVRIRHSVIDMGLPSFLFDGRQDNTFRGLEANPLVIELFFPKPRRISGVSVTVGRQECDIRLSVTPEKGGTPSSATKQVRAPTGDSIQRLDLPGGAIRAESLRLEIEDIHAGDRAHVEVRELALHD